MGYVNNNITDETKKRLLKWPTLKRAVDYFIKYDGGSPIPGQLADLTYYIKLLDLSSDICSTFGWELINLADEGEEEYTLWDDFCSWGHNSRYANVLESELMNNPDYYINAVLDFIDEDEEYEEPNLDED